MPEYGDGGRGMNVLETYLHILVCSVLLQVCRCCSTERDEKDSGCWYTLWYIWFVLGLFVVVFTILMILYIKHKTKQRSRVRRLQRNHRTQPIPVVAPQGPPSYTEASHKPPTYSEAMQTPRIVTLRHDEVARTVYTRPLPPGYGMTGGGLPGVADDNYANRPPPTSLRMASTTLPGTPPTRPPSYRTSVGHAT